MDLLKSFYDKKVQDYEIAVRRSDKTKQILLVYKQKNFNNGPEVLLKKFNDELSYRRFMDEAVALRLQCDDKSVKKARSAWRKIVDYLDDKRTLSGPFKTFLFCIFLLSGLTGCSNFSDFGVEHSKTEVITVKGEKFVCEYSKGSRISCNKFDLEKE